MSDSEYMPLGRSGGPYRAPGTPPARAVALLGVGMVCGYFLLDLVQPEPLSLRGQLLRFFGYGFADLSARCLLRSLLIARVPLDG